MSHLGDRFDVISVRGLIRIVADRWRSQYGRMSDPEKQSIQRRLDMLDPETATDDDVAAIIGNRLWTHVECDHCGSTTDPVVMLGDEPDYESRTANVCRACLVKAIEAIDNERADPNRDSLSEHG